MFEHYYQWLEEKEPEMNSMRMSGHHFKKPVLEIHKYYRGLSARMLNLFYDLNSLFCYCKSDNQGH